MLVHSSLLGEREISSWCSFVSTVHLLFVLRIIWPSEVHLLLLTVLQVYPTFVYSVIRDSLFRFLSHKRHFVSPSLLVWFSVLSPRFDMALRSSRALGLAGTSPVHFFSSGSGAAIHIAGVSWSAPFDSYSLLDSFSGSGFALNT